MPVPLGREPRTMVTTQNVRIIGVPLDLGSDRRGVDMGPSALRVAGLNARLRALGLSVEDAGNLPTAIAEMHSEGAENAKYIGYVAQSCQMQAQWIDKALAEGF